MSNSSQSIWNDPQIAKRYKAGERITGPAGRHLIRQAGLLQTGTKDSEPLVVFDNACGTGIIASLLHEMLDETAKARLDLTCGDFSEVMVQSIRHRIETKKWEGVKAQVVDAQKTGLPDHHFTHVLTNFGVMLMPDPTSVLNECFRILRSGGTCGLTTWHTVGWIPYARTAFNSISGAPRFPETDELMSSLGKGDWQHESFVRQQLTSHGFEDVEIQLVPGSFTVSSPEEFAEMFSAMIVQIVTEKFWSAEERERYSGSVRPALVRALTEDYGEGKPVELEMVAIVATARKP